MNPIIKYPGGKRQEIKYFEKYIPKNFNRYIEPFVGGGALFFYLEPEKSIINDLNSNLMQFYKDITTKKEQIIKELKEMENTEEYYYYIRDMYNGKTERKFLTSSMFFYLNRTAYSGMSRYNSKGEFNAPFGNYKNYHPWDFITEEASNLLKKAKMYNCDFKEIFKLVQSNDFVFLDPPYETNFKNYTKYSFSEEDHIRLLNCFKNSKGKCLAVIGDHGIIRELYKDYIKDEFEKKYSSNARYQHQNNNVSKHLIITNY